jgi:predicted site-specific integrase-resolvase
VATSTLRRWAEEGKIHSGTTIGGHRRYRESEISRLAQGLGLEEVIAN